MPRGDIGHPTSTPPVEQRARGWSGPPGLRHRTRRGVAAVTALVLLLTACTSEEPPEGELPAPEDEAAEPPTADDADTGSVQASVLQDVWMITRLRAVTDEGTNEDVIGEVVAELAELAEDPVQLVPEMAFLPVPELAPRIVTPTGGTRPDVELVAGLFQVTDEPPGLDLPEDAGLDMTLGVIATGPDGAGHVAPGDLLELELFTLSGLSDRPAALADYTFLQTVPPEDGAGSEPDDDPLALLASRWTDGRLHIAGPGAGQDGDVAVFTGMPVRRGTGELEASAAHLRATGPTVRTAATASGRAPELIPAQEGGGGGGGLIPAKARGPLARTAVTTLACVGAAALLGPASVVVIKTVCVAVAAGGAIYTVDRMIRRNLPGPEPECAPPCAGSSGDPHLRTFSGHRYDVHAAGEFTAVRSDDGEVVVQARMVPVRRTLAANGAVATSVGDSRVSIDADRDTPVYLDGAPVELEVAEVRDLPGGGHLLRHGAEIEVGWPDNTRLWVRRRGSTLDYRISIPEERVGAVSGLHGTGDGERRFADGELLLEQPTDERLRAFVDSWRITDETSLFDYPEGASTATYTDLAYPPERTTLADLEPTARLRARAICLGAGLLGADLRDCTLDVGATGDLSYVLSAWESQALFAPERFARAWALDAAYPDANTEPIDARAFTWLETIDDGLVVDDGAPLIANDEVVLLRIRGDSTTTLQARALDDGRLLWDLAPISGCEPALTPQGHVVVMIDDDAGRFVTIDAATGERLTEYEPPERLSRCTVGMAATTGGLALYSEVRSGSNTLVDTVHAFDVDAGLEPAWTRSFEDAQQDVLAWTAVEGERIYVTERGDGGVTLHRLDPATGDSLVEQPLPLRTMSISRNGSVVPFGEDGLAVMGPLADGSGDDALLLLRDEGQQLRTVWTYRFDDDAQVERRFRQIRVANGLVVGWTGSEVAALRLEDGTFAWRYSPSSFDNNGGAIAAGPGTGAVVGPFGRDWLEIVDPAGEAVLVIDEVPGVSGVNQLGPVIDDQVLIVGSHPSEVGGGRYIASLELP